MIHIFVIHHAQRRLKCSNQDIGELRKIIVSDESRYPIAFEQCSAHVNFGGIKAGVDLVHEGSLG